ncbi:MAG: hypothetical protein IJ347_03675 [Faecalibacterium sp.]|nr:hypothetical protein [Faecalibacterium sp.]
MKNHLLRIALALELAWIAGGTMAIFQLPAAYRWRGYWAIGGEWLLILLAAAVGGWIGWGIIRPARKRKKARQHRYC